MATQACYLFAPAMEDVRQDSRKRRKIVHAKTKSSPRPTSFVPLMRGTESEDAALHRHAIFDDLWQQQEDSLTHLVDHANSDTIQSLKEFVDTTYRDQHSKIPAGLLLQGPESGTFTSLFDTLSRSVISLRNTICIRLNSGIGPNLKTVCKYINRAVTSRTSADNETPEGNSRLLNYDLQILCNHVNDNHIRRVVLLFEDSEAFNGGLISDLIDVLRCWKDRIPFVLLFGVATSIELFQAKLSRVAIRCLEGRQFHVEQADPEDIFKTVHRGPCSIFLGPGLSKFLLERQRDSIQNPQTLIRAFKYVYMTHFFSNPLTSIMDSPAKSHLSDTEYITAVRHLRSFRRLVEQKIDLEKLTLARRLLNEDEEISYHCLQAAQTTPDILRSLVSAVNLVYLCIEAIAQHNSKNFPKWSELYILAMSNKLAESVVLEEMLTSLRRANARLLEKVLKSISEAAVSDHLFWVSETHEELIKILSHLPEETTDLRSTHDIQHSNLRTTVIAQKVELSRHAAKVTAEEAAYTTLIDKFIANLKGYLSTRLIDPQDLFLHEIFIYDAKSLHREVFTPHPRFAIERALSSPHDYLGCSCCGDDSAVAAAGAGGGGGGGGGGGLSSSQPATAIVYQLYLESGSTINVADLWSAFWTITGSGRESSGGEGEGEDEEHEEDDDVDKEEARREQALALFSRALAELEYMGMIKKSKKRADHLAKLLWKGL